MGDKERSQAGRSCTAYYRAKKRVDKQPKVALLSEKAHQCWGETEPGGGGGVARPPMVRRWGCKRAVGASSGAQPNGCGKNSWGGTGGSGILLGAAGKMVQGIAKKHNAKKVGENRDQGRGFCTRWNLRAAQKLAYRSWTVTTFVWSEQGA